MNSYKEMLEAFCGVDASGHSKVYLSMYHEMVDKYGNRETIAELDLDKPVINLFVQPGFVMVDFIYQSSKDADLAEQWYFLSNYYQHQNSMNPEEETIPAFVLVVIPKEHESEFHLLAENPIFPTLQPSDPQNPEPRVIRLIFTEENIAFYHTDENLIDKRKIENKIEDEQWGGSYEN